MFNLEFLAVIRADELEEIERALPAQGRILELGGGTGQQARMLSERGYDVVSVDVAASEYRNHRVFPVLEYDGRRLPFENASFDIVVSSNVLEHVSDLTSLFEETSRVLSPGGVCVHVMPTHSWRFWTSVTHYIDLVQRVGRTFPHLIPRSFTPSGLLLHPLRGVAQLIRTIGTGLLPERHGERGNVMSELVYFRPAWWRREFTSQGFHILEDRPMQLFYTGYMTLGPRLGIDARRRISDRLGSACHLFKIFPNVPERVTHD